jgi:hypothetical protein
MFSEFTKNNAKNIFSPKYPRVPLGNKKKSFLRAKMQPGKIYELSPI